MDIVISAVASELVSRFISFVINRYRNKSYLKNNLERLQHLVLRVHMVVEEAEGRYIANSGMLTQLKMLAEAMFQGYQVLDTYGPWEKIREEEEVSGSYTLDLPCLKQFRMASSAIVSREVQSALEKLEIAAANMKDFVSLLMGCERMFRIPYSSYLYIDNFMFGRSVERQQIISILMLDHHFRVPTVLPIVGGCRVGKKTLVANVCNDERVRSYFSSILHFNGGEINKINGHKFMPVKTLVIIEFLSDVDEMDWFNFYSLLKVTSSGSKVIIISRHEKLTRFGTINPVRIKRFSPEEYSYLFKVLAFGSADPMDYPRLAILGKELSTMMQGSLVKLNVYASVLRNNLSVQFWIRVLKLYKGMMENNLSLYGEHPTTLLAREGTMIDITQFSLSSSPNSFWITRLTRGCMDNSKGELPTMEFGDMIAGSVIMPKKFQLVWQSRLPPYTVISATCAAEKARCAASPRKKRPRLCQFL